MKYSILHLLGDDNFYETEYTVKVTNSFSGDQYEVKVKADNPDQAIIKIKDTFSERSDFDPQDPQTLPNSSDGATKLP